MNGFINVLKPPGMTSHDVVSWLRQTLKIKRIGHGGTLDPDVAGVLVIAIGQATRLLEYLLTNPKSYRCEILLGMVTDSQDLSGKILEKRHVPNDYRLRFTKVTKDFIGAISQVPPMISAVHHNGRRLYELAREGLVVEREPRTVNIYSLEIVDWGEKSETPRILFDVSCSKGTYIRTLCHDIGEAIGCGATMSYLLRTASFPFTIDNAWTLEEISSALNDGRYDFILPYDYALQGMPVVTVRDEAVLKVLNGVGVDERDVVEIAGPINDGKPLCIYNRKGILLAIGIGRQQEGLSKIKLCKVFKNEG